MPLVTFDDRKIDGVVESGSNTNGNWVKFSDGTMICWHAITVTNQAINTSYTSGHYTGNRTLTFPQTFIDVPVPLLSKFRWGTSASWVPFANCTESTIQIYAMDTVSRATGTSVYISYAVIGRWK